MQVLKNGRGTLCAALAFGTLTAALNAPMAHAEEIGYQLSAGVSEQDFSWNIAGNLAGQNPNVLSELSWSSLRLLQVEGLVKVLVGTGLREHPLFLQLGGGYGVIVSGDNRDSDYFADNRQGEFSRSNNGADDGESLNASIALGVDFKVRPWLLLSPQVGYGYRELNLVIQDGYQTLDTIGNHTGPFAGLNSSYDANWHGPFVGLDASLRYSPSWQWFGAIKYAWNDSYYAAADWNLRGDLAHPKSFSHHTEGVGLDLVLGATYYLDWRTHSHLSLSVTRQRWEGDSGIDQVFAADGRVLHTRLNGVEWDSTAILLNYRRGL